MSEGDWLRENPGHCSRCGLPSDRCFHWDSAFRAEVRTLGERVHTSRGMDAYYEIAKRWYFRALDAIGLDMAERLPVPLDLYLVEWCSEWASGRRPA